MSNENYGFDTLKVRAGYNAKEHNNAVSVPIYQTAAFDFGDTDRVGRLLTFSEFGFVYTRVANPTVAVLEQRLAALDGASGAVAVASGMAAVTYTLFNAAEDGGRILTTRRVYGGTFDTFKKIYPKFNIGIDFVENPDDPEEFRKGIKENTKAIYVETISNPNAAIADLEKLAAIAHENDIPLIVDNTIATPYLLNPIKYGADVVVYSATKAIGGHGNTIAGVILESGKFNWGNGKFRQFTEKYHTLRDADGNERSFLDVVPKFPFTTRIRTNYLGYFGAALSPFDAYLILQGLETISERVQKQVSNAEKVVQYLETKKEVAWVNHPTAKDSPYKALKEKYLPKGAGSVFTFGVAGTAEQIDKLINSVQLFGYQANLGDARSLIVNSPKTTHGELTAEEQNKAGIRPETIRLSLGLEDPKDLIADLEQAFEKAFS